MSSKSARVPAHSSSNTKARTLRLVLASLCLIAFVTGTFLLQLVSDPQRTSVTETAGQAGDNSSEANVTTSLGGNKTIEQRALNGDSQVSNRKEETTRSLKPSRQGSRLDKQTEHSKAHSIGDESTGEVSFSTQASSISQAGENSQPAIKEMSDETVATHPLSSASLSDPAALSGSPSSGRRTRFPTAAQGTNPFTPQGQQSSETKIMSGPEVVPIIGPVSQDEDLRKLPYIPPTVSEDETRLKRHPDSSNHGVTDPARPFSPPSSPASMPSPSHNFDGVNAATSLSGLIPPDAHGDVGPNLYIQSVNSSIQIFSKSGSSIAGPTTFNSFFSALGASTPCGTSHNAGDGFVFYDHLASRWVVTDFAFNSFPGNSFYECVGVSKTSDPVAGGWWLYALQVDSSNPSFLGDYPKLALWPDAYYLSVNLFSSNVSFDGVRVYALNRSAMLNGTGAPNPSAVAFSISPATLGDAYSLVPATFRTGSPPPAGRPEYFLAINSSLNAGTLENQIFAWRFHVDFVTPGNSTFGVGAAHTPNGAITVNDFVDAFTNTTAIVPQPPGSPSLDSLGDRMMSPVVYQNLSGTESLWASHTVNNNENGTGPTAIRWYQFNVTGSAIPATAAQQQTFDNGADGLWRWMPSIAADTQGNMSIGYSVSGFTMDPAIRYAGRLGSDPLNSLAQGEAELIAGGGHQNASRWGDYSALAVDPSDNCTFWHTNEYYPSTSSSNWSTRIGSFRFPSCGLVCTTITGTVSGGGTICPGGSTTVTVNVSGGTLPYTVKLTNNGETQTGTVSQTQFIFTVSPAANTTYQVDIAMSHDTNNCPLTNSGGATVFVNTAPATPAITTSSAVCGGSTGNQAIGPSGVTTYAWTIMNGAITSATNTQTITYTAFASGSVTLGLTVTNAAGCGTSNSVGVPINPSPTAVDIALGGPQTVTVTGSSGTFTLTFKGQTTAALAFNATASTVQSKLSALTTIGVGGVTVTQSGNVYKVTFTGLQTGPQPLMTGAGSGGASVAVTFQVCAGSTGNQAGSPASSAYAWSISNGIITSANNIQNITYTAGGIGNVSLNLTVTNSSSCSTSSSTIVTIKPSALDRLSQSFPGNGGTGTVNVTPTDATCAWTASTSSTFINITSGSSGTGNGIVQYSVAANPGPSIRNNTIAIAGQTFTVYQGINFLDVPADDPFYNEIGKLSARGVTVGCGNGNYCENGPVTREQMAAFIMRAKGEFNPPPPGSQRFNDVPPSNQFYSFIDRLAVLQITVGCQTSPPLYCPSDPVKRDQMAAFILRGLGEFNPPAPATQRFGDVPPQNTFYNFVDRLAALQITLGCTPDHLMYCPNDSVTRAQMAAFLVRAFGL
jgi:hypothetical protein